MIDVNFDGVKIHKCGKYKLIAPLEKTILFALLNFNHVDFDMVASLHWKDEDDMPDLWQTRIRSCISRLNKKLTILGSMYHITKRNQRRFTGYCLEKYFI